MKMTDEQMEQELERLKASKHVKLAQKEIRLKTKQRKYLYQLRWLEKRGKQLESEGITMENIDAMIEAIPEEKQSFEI